jgi:DNA-binding transcriptional ArsR family regulator
MQISEELSPRDPVTVVGPSLAVELSWATHSVWSENLVAKHRTLRTLAADHPSLIRSIREFWGDETECFPEFTVLTGFARALGETDFDRLFAALDAARGRVPANMPLRSETDEDRSAIRTRLARLAADDALWAAYVDLFRSLYAALADWWHATATPAVEQAVASARRELDRGAVWTRMIASAECTNMEELLPEIIQRGDPVVLVVCALFGKLLYLDLPGYQLIGLGAGLGEVGARARTSGLARRIRVLADPTRLAILDHLRAGPRSVGDIALDFGLAQPTVSAHVKQLREAGLVSAVRRGPRLELTMNADALSALAGELTAAVAG